jgi:C-terminal processing protease CtpA/Prc
MRKSIFFLIYIGAIFTACVSTKKYNSKIRAKHSPEKLKVDLDIIKKSLEEAHPGVYWYISKSELDFKFDSLKNILTDSASSIEFYRMVAPVVAAVKCGHTRLVYPGIKLSSSQKDSIKNAGKAPLAQLHYFVDSNRIYVPFVNDRSLVKYVKGAEILAIDSVPTSEIIKQTKRLFSSDGYNQTFYNQVLDQSFAAYYYLKYARKDSSLLTLKKADSTYNYYIKTIEPQKSKRKINLLSAEEDKKIKEQQRLANKIKNRNRYKGIDNEGKSILNFSYDSIIKSTAIIKVKSFAFDHSNFHRFFRESFKEIKEKNIQNLILDLRDNGGGNLMSCNLLFRYLCNKKHQYTGRAYITKLNPKALKYKDDSSFTKTLNILLTPTNWLAKRILTGKDSIGYYNKLPTDHFKKPKKYVYDQKLFVLTNGFSFSATSLLSANLQQVNTGTFIGEETGGGYNKCTAGRIPYLVLPETNLKLRLPLKVIQTTNQRKLEGRGVFPKYLVKENFPDVLNRKDKALEKARALIKVQDNQNLSFQ